jgi:DNA-binding FadR family transcriptional regulator
VVIPRQRRMPRSGGIRARQHISEQIKRCIGSGTTRLPTITELALAAHVSRSAMHRAVRELQSQGVLQARHRSGITLPAAPASAPPAGAPSAGLSEPPALQSRRLVNLRERIETDIVQGRYQTAHMLPGAKELTAIYGASYPTIRKALNVMASAGSVEHWKRGFRPAVHQASAHRNTIVLVVRGIDGTGDSESIGAWTPRNSEQFQALGLECGRANLDIDFAVYRFVDRILLGADGGRRLTLAPQKRDRTLGFMVWTQGLTKLDLPDFVGDLSRHRLPVAILDVNGQNDFRPLLHAGSLVRLFPLGITPRCGSAVARYLRGLGHEHIACFTRDEGEGARVDGIRSVYSVAAQPDAVTLYHIPPPGESAPARDHFRRAVRTQARMGPHVDSALMRMAARHEEQLTGMYNEERAYARADEVFAEALADPRPTAWVADTDATAIRCLGFLRSRGVDVPGQISLVGFDDTEQAFLRGLTSYNFNVPAIVHAMTEHLVRPQPLRPGAGNGAHADIDGFVNVRRTTAQRAHSRGVCSHTGNPKEPST